MRAMYFAILPWEHLSIAWEDEAGQHRLELDAAEMEKCRHILNENYLQNVRMHEQEVKQLLLRKTQARIAVLEADLNRERAKLQRIQTTEKSLPA